MQKAARAVWDRYAKGELTHPQAIDELYKLNKPKAVNWQSQAGQSLGRVTTGSYVKPGPIAPDMPALDRLAGKKAAKK